MAVVVETPDQPLDLHKLSHPVGTCHMCDKVRVSRGGREALATFERVVEMWAHSLAPREGSAAFVVSPAPGVRTDGLKSYLVATIAGGLELVLAIEPNGVVRPLTVEETVEAAFSSTLGQLNGG